MLVNASDGVNFVDMNQANALGGPRTLDAAALSATIGVRIQGLFAAQAGMGLDNVVLSANAVGAVPEPQTCVLMLAGLAVVGRAAPARLSGSAAQRSNSSSKRLRPLMR